MIMITSIKFSLQKRVLGLLNKLCCLSYNDNGKGKMFGSLGSSPLTEAYIRVARQNRITPDSVRSECNRNESSLTNLSPSITTATYYKHLSSSLQTLTRNSNSTSNVTSGFP